MEAFAAAWGALDLKGPFLLAAQLGQQVLQLAWAAPINANGTYRVSVYRNAADGWFDLFDWYSGNLLRISFAQSPLREAMERQEGLVQLLAQFSQAVAIALREFYQAGLA